MAGIWQDMLVSEQLYQSIAKHSITLETREAFERWWKTHAPGLIVQLCVKQRRDPIHLGDSEIKDAFRACWQAAEQALDKRDGIDPVWREFMDSRFVATKIPDSACQSGNF